MNREQARAILAHIDLIRHFAKGGDIGHRHINCKGDLVRISPTDKILLSGMQADSTFYVKVKARYETSKESGKPIRIRRCWTQEIYEHEIIPCLHEDHES